LNKLVLYVVVVVVVNSQFYAPPVFEQGHYGVGENKKFLKPKKDTGYNITILMPKVWKYRG
jgi:hypothetical protein